VRLASLTPVEGQRKVLVLDEFHLLAEAAAAILLKTVEEPPPSTIFVILADDVPPELVTIASRCARIEFRPVPHDVVVAVLEQEGHPLDAARLAADGAAGNLDRARVLAADPMAAARRDAFRHVAGRLDGAGATVAATVDELLGLIDASLEPLKQRQAAETTELDERAAQLGERRSDRKEMDDRHRRELRRYRTDELRAGLVTLAASYRDRLATGTMPDPADGLAAVALVAEAIEAMERNPNERLLLEALLLRLPGV
jgi:DNA polymerase-3 subunit delta'